MRYHIFGRTGLRVSPLALGTGNFGSGWGYGSTEQEAEAVFRVYREAGGNFLDAADQYQFGQSEEMVGAFIAGERDDIIVATKYSLGSEAASGLQITSNSRKAMVQSVEKSLARLKTDRIHLLWVHFPDGVTPIVTSVKPRSLAMLAKLCRRTWAVISASAVFSNICSQWFGKLPKALSSPWPKKT